MKWVGLFGLVISNECDLCCIKVYIAVIYVMARAKLAMLYYRVHTKLENP